VGDANASCPGECERRRRPGENPDGLVGGQLNEIVVAPPPPAGTRRRL